VTAPKDPREDKLPQWAQRQLDTLRRDVEHHRQQLKELAALKGGVIFRDPYLRPTPVAGVNDLLRVKLDDRDLGDYLEFRWTGDWLDVRSSRSLVVQPQSSNVVRIRGAEYWSKGSEK